MTTKKQPPKRQPAKKKPPQPVVAEKTGEEKDLEYEALAPNQKHIYNEAPDKADHETAMALALAVEPDYENWYEDEDGYIYELEDEEIVPDDEDEDDTVPEDEDDSEEETLPVKATKPAKKTLPKNLGVASGERKRRGPARGADSTQTDGAVRRAVATKPKQVARVATGKRPLPKRGA